MASTIQPLALFPDGTMSAPQAGCSCVSGTEEEEIPTILLTQEQAIQILDVKWLHAKHHHHGPTKSSDTTSSSTEDKEQSFITVEEVDSDSESSSSSFQTVSCSLARSSSSSLPRKRRRAAFLSASVYKESQETKLGMGLQRKDGHLQISSMRRNDDNVDDDKDERYLLSAAPFQVGDKLISINNKRCAKMSPIKVAALLKATTGVLTIVVENPLGDPQLVESMIVKTNPKTKTGLALTQCGERLKVSSIDPKGISVESLLNRRDRILSINNTPTDHLDVTDAAKIIVKAKRNVTIVAQREPESAVVVGL